MYFETVLDVMIHNPSSSVSTDMIKLVCATIDQNMPIQLFENNIGRVIKRKGLTEKPQAEQVVHEKIEIDFDSQAVMGKLYVLLECITLGNMIVNELHSTMQQEELEMLLSKLQETHKMAKEFNSSILLRFLLWKNGYNAKSPQLPSLYKMEKVSTDCILLHLKKNITHFTIEKEEGKTSFFRYLE